MRRIIRFLAGISLLMLANTIAYSQEAPRQIDGAKTVDCTSVIELMGSTPDLVIVDTRRHEDFDLGHIEGAITLPDVDMTEATLAAAVKTKSTPILFYCNGVKCGRAARATRNALTWGYTAVFYYAEGTKDWIANRLPLVTN